MLACAICSVNPIHVLAGLVVLTAWLESVRPFSQRHNKHV